MSLFCVESDGKAGMAVIIDDESAPIDMSTLVFDLKKYGLPSYARPCFVRLTKHIELTGALMIISHFSLADLRLPSSSGTFKVKKTVFQDEGFDLSRVHEPIFYLNQKRQVYERLTPEAYDLIMNEKIRF